MPTPSKPARLASPKPGDAISPPARHDRLVGMLEALGQMPPAEMTPLHPLRVDLVHGGRAVTFLVRSTTPLRRKA
jgi:hypothetical protein